MPNSDNKFGTYNKRTSIFSQKNNGSTALTIFADVDVAKSHFFTTAALAVWDETCTTIQWVLVKDGNGDNTKLKVTFDFGTKGGQIDPADDWAEQYNSRKKALMHSNSWFKNPAVAAVDQPDHLF